MARTLTLTLIAALLGSGAAAVLAAPAQPGRAALEGGRTLPVKDGWARVGPAEAEEVIKITVAIKQRNIDVLERELMAVSDPDSPRYSQHLSHAEVHALVAPAPESVSAVLGWLAAHEASGSDVVHSPNSDFVSAHMSIRAAEQLLGTKYDLYRHESGATAVRTTRGYSAPLDVAPHVDMVTPTLRLPVVPAPRVSKAPAKGSNGLGVTPDFLRQLYNTHNVTGTNPKTTQAVASFLEQYFAPSDLQEFFKLWAPGMVGTNATVIGPNSGLAGTEASLDIQYIMGVAQGTAIKTTFWSTPGRNPNNPDNEPFLAWLQNVSADANAPMLFSISYGEDEQSVGYDYAVRVNTEFMKNGARGISFLAASGDSGAGGNCTASKGKLNPNFPVGSPYVTGVGGVEGGTAGKIPTGEVTDYISGGGVSNLWARPAWQKAAVAGYLANATGLPDPKTRNVTGRGYPDVAAQSEFFYIVQFGIPMPGVSGTSCASPSFSGIITLLNDARLNAGKKQLGFLNPMLYKAAAAQQAGGADAAPYFSDIVQGSNAGCNGAGYPARKGWDAATGHGSPNYEALKAFVLSLP